MQAALGLFRQCCCLATARNRTLVTLLIAGELGKRNLNHRGQNARNNHWKLIAGRPWQRHRYCGLAKEEQRRPKGLLRHERPLTDEDLQLTSFKGPRRVGSRLSG